MRTPFLISDVFISALWRYGRETAATIAIAFALLAPVLVGSAGMALDMAQAYLVRERLAHALDSAALAAASSAADGADLEQRLQNFFNANYPPEALGITYNLNYNIDGDDITVTVDADYQTFFLSILGINEITVNAKTVVRREVRGLEVVMVLDNTGSMSTNNNIGTLKTATELFIENLFDSTDEPEFIKIGLVPYANSVRVGVYGLGQNPDGSVYGNGEAFVTLPAGVVYNGSNHNTTNSSRWYGCVIEHEEGGWKTSINNNDPYPDDVLDNYRGPWEIYRYGSWNNTTRQYVPASVASTNCPYANIVPLTSDQEKLMNAVDTMVAHGNTLSNIGLTWGYRVLSPEFPFQEGAAWTSQVWRKAVVVMTDGVNTRDNNYSAYWLRARNQLTVDDYNERFLETCNALKAKDVTVYTVIFGNATNDPDLRDLYQSCASDSTKFFPAATQDSLVSVFNQISRELANLHIRG